MEEKCVKQLAIEIFNLVNPVPCRCGGNHEVCLSCKPCREYYPDQLYDPGLSINNYIDHTKLKADTSRHEIKSLCDEADENEFKAVCVNPTHVFTARYALETSKLCVVVGFPLGANTTGVKVYEALKAIEQKVDEVDMVINVGTLKTKDFPAFHHDIFEVCQVCHKSNVLLKVIIETNLLNETEKIIACLTAKKAGADFVKTSTGFEGSKATLEDVELMRAIVGPKMGVKASGGIRDYATALSMLKAGANRLGTSSGLTILAQGNENDR